MKSRAISYLEVVEKKLGGGMGVVYKAEGTRLGITSAGTGRQGAT